MVASSRHSISSSRSMKQNDLEVVQGFKLCKPALSGLLPLTRLPLLLFPSSRVNWGPGVQMPEPVGDTSHPNHQHLEANNVTDWEEG